MTNDFLKKSKIKGTRQMTQNNDVVYGEHALPLHPNNVGLIRSRGHFPKGGYDVPDGATNQGSAPTPAV